MSFTKEELELIKESLGEKLHRYEGFLKIQPKDKWCSERAEIARIAIAKIKAGMQ